MTRTWFRRISGRLFASYSSSVLFMYSFQLLCLKNISKLCQATMLVLTWSQFIHESYTWYYVITQCDLKKRLIMRKWKCQQRTKCIHEMYSFQLYSFQLCALFEKHQQIVSSYNVSVNLEPVHTWKLHLVLRRNNSMRSEKRVNYAQMEMSDNIRHVGHASVDSCRAPLHSITVDSQE